MSANATAEWIAVILILIGSILSVISAIGIIRFPDVYTRSHAATKSASLAVLLTLFGAFVYLWVTEAYFSVRILLGIAFVFITAPVAGHLVCRAAYRSNVKLTEATIEDELQEVLKNND